MKAIVNRVKWPKGEMKKTLTTSFLVVLFHPARHVRDQKAGLITNTSGSCTFFDTNSQYIRTYVDHRHNDPLWFEIIRQQVTDHIRPVDMSRNQHVRCRIYQGKGKRKEGARCFTAMMAEHAPTFIYPRKGIVIGVGISRGKEGKEDVLWVRRVMDPPSDVRRISLAEGANEDFALGWTVRFSRLSTRETLVRLTGRKRRRRVLPHKPIPHRSSLK